MNRNKRSRTSRTLELKKETVVLLGEAKLRNAIGGRTDQTAGNSEHLSMCDAVCQSH